MVQVNKVANHIKTKHKKLAKKIGLTLYDVCMRSSCFLDACELRPVLWMMNVLGVRVHVGHG